MSENSKTKISHPKVINKDKYAEISDIGDGNCFFRCLSLSKYLEKNENNYNYYRILIYNFIKSNKQILKDFFYYLDDESQKEYNERYESYIENIQNDKNYATDFEISAAAMALKKTIIIYR